MTAAEAFFCWMPGVGFEQRGVDDEDAVGVAGGELVEEGKDLGSAAGADESLGAEVVGVVGEGVAGGRGLMEFVVGLGVAVVEGVGVAEREVGGGGGHSRVAGGVVGDGVIRDGAAGGRKLLSHGAQRGRGDECAVEAEDALGRGGFSFELGGGELFR